MKKMIPIYLSQLLMLVSLVFILRELRTLRSLNAELTGIRQQMATPQGLRPSRAGGGIPVYVTNGPPLSTKSVP
jgi:hypothetical protein